MENTNIHIPVLLHETIEALNLKKGSVVLDATVNGGGHSEAIAKKYGKDVSIIGIDLDIDGIARSEKKLSKLNSPYFLVNDSYVNMEKIASDLSFPLVDAVLFDFGISSDQYESGRGFSFKKNEPLLMTFSKNFGNNSGDYGNVLTALDVVNGWEESSLEAIIRGFGEEKYARSIARGIINAREVGEIKTTDDLVNVIKNSTPKRYHHGRIHPATRTFQAIRMAVNGELDAIARGLNAASKIVRKNGRIVAISFHSLEDRLVKRFFKDLVTADPSRKLINKKPIMATDAEMESNPRSRSAKMRIVSM